MEFDDPRSETGKVKETYTKPIFFIDLNNTFRLPHLCLRASINDMLQRSVQDIRMSCGGYQLFESQLRSNHRLNISLRYTFNASKSKYKGTGAGQAERQRM